MTHWWCFWKNYSKRLILKKKSRRQKRAKFIQRVKQVVCLFCMLGNFACPDIVLDKLFSNLGQTVCRFWYGPISESRHLWSNAYLRQILELHLTVTQCTHLSQALINLPIVFLVFAGSFIEMVKWFKQRFFPWFINTTFYHQLQTLLRVLLR